MAVEDGSGDESPLAQVVEDIRRELVFRVARADLNEHRDVYDALETEQSRTHSRQRFAAR